MILHVDMDAFFASVEQLDNPDLKDQCVLVGGLSDRAVVAACSYEARKHGIHSAMPMFQARRKCPDAVIVPPRRARYKELSGKIMNVLGKFSPLVEPVSIDEAYVDITGCDKLLGDPIQVGKAIKRKIKETVNLTCSVGVAPVKFLAKIASDLDKPDGLTLIEQDEVMGFIEILDIGKVPGVGPKMQVQLRKLGIGTLGDVRKYPEKVLAGQLGEKTGYRLRELSFGLDSSEVTPESAPKSISSEETLAANTRDKKVLDRYILRQAEDVARQLRGKSLRARTVTVKIKHADFTLITRRSSLPRPSQSTSAIVRHARGLLAEYTVTKEIRLIGVAASGLLPSGTPVQMDLFSDKQTDDQNWEKVEQAVDSIARRFGKGTIQRANLKKTD